MSCRALRKLLSPYLDGELAPAQQERVAAHLAACAACAAALQRLRGAARAVEQLDALEPSAGFDAGFARKLAQAQTAPPQRARSLWRRLGLPAFAATALAGSAAAILLLVTGGQPGAPAAPVSDLELAQRIELLQDLEVVEHLDGLEDFAVVSELDAVLQLQEAAR